MAIADKKVVTTISLVSISLLWVPKRACESVLNPICVFICVFCPESRHCTHTFVSVCLSSVCMSPFLFIVVVVVVVVFDGLWEKPPILVWDKDRLTYE